MKSHAIQLAVAALGAGPLSEEALVAQVHPLFRRVLERKVHAIYLANHSLGRPLDQTACDMAECAALWYQKMDDAWSDWLEEMKAFRSRIAQLVGAPRGDCIVPKMSAGQGLRAILNTYHGTPRVVTTRGEFDSLDFILKQYATKHRAQMTWVEPNPQGRFELDSLRAAIVAGTDLVVLSQVYFASGQVLDQLPELVAYAHERGARVLLDAYHAVGVFPVDFGTLEVDFAVGGSYKYLRGGPGACWLYVHPRHLDGSLTTLDTGWFAKKDTFRYARGDTPQFAAGGDAFLESTPAVLPLYQARAGQQFTLAIGVERLRAYSLEQQRVLIDALAQVGVSAEGASEAQGAFVVVQDARAMTLAEQLRQHGVTTDARGEYLRLCPDILNTCTELREAARRMGELMSR